MNRFTRFFNQNISKILLGVAIVAFIFVMIQLLNSLYKEKKLQNINNEINQNQEDIEKYEEESKALVSGEEISGTNKIKYGQIIENFIKNCISGKYDEAYKILSEDCKRELYPTKKLFIDKYCKDKIGDKKNYEFQLWSSSYRYVYLVKYYDDMLSTGFATNKYYVQDYYCLEKDGSDYKLNINGYIGRKSREKKTEEKNIKITVDYSDIYMDYEIYKITVKNNTEKDILLDSRKETNNVFLTDENGYEYEAFMYEFTEEDIIIKSGEEKDIKIKFSDNYNDGLEMEKITFEKIIKDYQNYLSNYNYNDYVSIEIEL